MLISFNLARYLILFVNVEMLPHREPLHRANLIADAICVSHRASASVFCMQCNSFMCMQCFEGPSHAGHIILSIQNAQQRMQERDQQLRDLLNATLSQIDQQIGHVRSQQAGRAEFVCTTIERIAQAERELHRIVTQFCTTLTTELLQQAGDIECGERNELLTNSIRHDDCDRLRRELSRSQESMSAKGKVLTHVADALNKVHGQAADATVGEAPAGRAGPTATASDCQASLPKKVKLDAALQPEETNRKGSGPGESGVASLSTINDWLAKRAEDGWKWAQNEQSAVLRSSLLHVIYQSKTRVGKLAHREHRTGTAMQVAYSGHTSIGGLVYTVCALVGQLGLHGTCRGRMRGDAAAGCARHAHLNNPPCNAHLHSCKACLLTGTPGECGTTNTGSRSMCSLWRYGGRIGCISAGAAGRAILILPGRVNSFSHTRHIIYYRVSCEILELSTSCGHFRHG